MLKIRKLTKNFIGGGQKSPLPKICHAYPTMMKLGTVIPYLKKTEKIHESSNIFLINMVTILMMSTK